MIKFYKSNLCRRVLGDFKGYSHRPNNKPSCLSLVSVQRSAKMRKKVSGHENPTFSPLDLDGPTQEFNLETPCVRRVYEEMSTPEMPDLSSVTQDICKVRAYLYSSENILQLF